MSPEKLSMVVDLLPHVKSIREIARIIGMSDKAVGNAARPFIALMEMNGTIPRCLCGKPRFHPYGCEQNTPVPIDGERLQRREAILEDILQGESYRTIATRHGIHRRTVGHYLARLSPEQQAARRALNAERANRGQA